MSIRRGLLIVLATSWMLAAHAQSTMPDGWDKERHDLWFALRTRILTDEEMAKVAGYGDMINIEYNVSYNPGEKAKELNEAYLQQFKMRAAAKCKTGD